MEKKEKNSWKTNVTLFILSFSALYQHLITRSPADSDGLRSVLNVVFMCVLKISYEFKVVAKVVITSGKLYIFL